MGKRKLILGQNKKAGGKSFKVFCVKGGKRGGGGPGEGGGSPNGTGEECGGTFWAN